MKCQVQAHPVFEALKEGNYMPPTTRFREGVTKYMHPEQTFPQFAKFCYKYLICNILLNKPTELTDNNRERGRMNSSPELFVIREFVDHVLEEGATSNEFYSVGICLTEEIDLKFNLEGVCVYLDINLKTRVHGKC